MNLLKTGFSGSILILAVIVVRAVSLHYLPKKTFTVLWGITLFHLILPVSIPAPFSIYSLTVKDMYVQDASLLSGPSAPQWHVIWSIGAAFLALLFMISYLRCMRKFRLSTPVRDEFAMQWLEKYQIRRRITIRQSDRIITPLTYGTFRPVILLPKWTDWKNEKQLQYILQHEYVHICHFDTAVKLAAAFTLCIYWWNPMVWIMYLLFNRDIELVCDECVLRELGEEEKSSYALALIHMEESRIRPALFYNGFSKNTVEERVIAIMKSKKRTVSAFVLSCFLVLGISGVFATSVQGDKPNKIYYIFSEEQNYKILFSFDGGKSCYVCDEIGKMSLVPRLKEE